MQNVAKGHEPTFSRFRDISFRSEQVRASYPAVFFRLARYYWSKGRAARKLFWGCLWKTLRQAPRIVGQMIIFMGMYMHFCEVHQEARRWDPWAAPQRAEELPALQEAPPG